jgi:hypothetical protein
MKKNYSGINTLESSLPCSPSSWGRRVQALAVSAVQIVVVVCVWDLARVGRLDSVWGTLALVAIAAPNALDVLSRVVGRVRATKSD